ncbi:MAG: DUF1700 domain-containing protein [Parvularcula sp.]|jgi:uncharacterized membrane protein|nr:DUF1700 domain-containing protein [Parvularcula sp.]
MQEPTIELRDNYLRTLASALGPLPATMRREILDELSSHVTDAYEAKGEGGAETMREVLERIGSPQLVARSYIAEYRLAEGARTFSARKIASGLFRAIGTSFGLSFLSGAFIGLYAVPIILMVAGIGKILVPSSGLFVHDQGWVLSFHPQPHATEILGWWLVPLGIGGGLLGCVGVTLLLRYALGLRTARSLPRYRPRP